MTDPVRPQQTRVERWEARLKALFDEIDAELEAHIAATPALAARYPLHPVRPPSGATSNPEDDGHIEIGASFTVGYGSVLGPGYVLVARLATLAHVTPDAQAALEDLVAQKLAERLPSHLHVDRDPPPSGPYKIHGDLSLD